MGQSSSCLENCLNGQLGQKPSVGWDSFCLRFKEKKLSRKILTGSCWNKCGTNKCGKITQNFLHIISIGQQLQYFAMFSIKGFQTFDKQ